MRSHRAVKDDDVDRLQVQGRRRPQPSSTNSPPALPVKAHTLVSAPWVFRMSASAGVRVFSSGLSLFCFRSISETSYSGGFGPGVPPLPIPNREVKPGRADGTAPQCGRVGRRLLSMKSLRFRKISEAFLFFFPRIFFFSLNISLSRRFRRFFLIDYFVPQISRISTDLLWLTLFSSFPS